MVEQRRAMVHLRRATGLRKVDHGPFRPIVTLAARSPQTPAPNSTTARFFRSAALDSTADSAVVPSRNPSVFVARPIPRPGVSAVFTRATEAYSALNPEVGFRIS